MNWDEEVEVISVGTGGGLCGAYTAAREGLRTAVVEATEKFGGTTAYSSGGGLWFPTNEVLTAAGAGDTLADAKEYFHAVVGDRTPQDLQDAYVEHGPAVISYLLRDPVFAFVPYPWPDYFGRAPKAKLDGMRHIVPAPLPLAEIGEDLASKIRGPLDNDRWGVPADNTTLIGGRALVGRFLLGLTQYPNASLHLNTTLVELVPGDDHNVAGAVVERDGERIAIRATKGIILSAGGFEQNQALRTEHGVPGRAGDTMGPWGNVGKALEAAQALGAATDLLDQAWWSPGMTHPDGRSAFALWFTGGIFVNQEGQRFVNESAPYDRLGRDIIDQLNQGRMTLPYWMVYDNKEGEIPPSQATNVSMVEPQRYHQAGLRHTADTLEELATKIGVPPAALVATVERFNRFARRGVDEDFGRGEEAYDRWFTEGRSPLVPIDQGPFHAARFGLSDLGTKGGLRTDARARVLHTDGGVIGGLYAAGNTMAAVTGTVYPGGGNPIGASVLFSHLAALDMAANPR